MPRFTRGFVFVCSFRRSKGGACFLCRNLRLRIFQPVDFILGMRVEGVVHLFQSPFVVRDAPVLVRLPRGYGAMSPASGNLVKTKVSPMTALRVIVLLCAADSAGAPGNA